MKYGSFFCSFDSLVCYFFYLLEEASSSELVLSADRISESLLILLISLSGSLAALLCSVMVYRMVALLAKVFASLTPIFYCV